MYSLGMRGSWWENTFCRPTSHIRIFLLGFWFRELPTTWNSITPRRSSSLAASSLAECADKKLFWDAGDRKKLQSSSLKTVGIGHSNNGALLCSNKLWTFRVPNNNVRYENKIEKVGKAFWEIRVLDTYMDIWYISGVIRPFCEGPGFCGN